MSKFGWDLPPGVTHRMIEDQATGGPEGRAFEAFAEGFFNEYERVFGKIVSSATEDNLTILSDWVWQQIGEAYNKGYKQGMDDEKFASEQERLNEDELKRQERSDEHR